MSAQFFQKLAAIDAPRKLQKLDYFIGAGLLAWGLAYGIWWMALLGGAEIVMAYFNVGQKLGTMLAKPFVAKKRAQATAKPGGPRPL